MKKLLIIVTLSFLIISLAYAFSPFDYENDDSISIMDFIEDDTEDCELNKMSTKKCPTYSADHCIYGSWFIK